MIPDIPDRLGCEMCEQVDKALIMAHLMRNEVIPITLLADYNHWALILSRPRLVQHAAGPIVTPLEVDGAISQLEAIQADREATS